MKGSPQPSGQDDKSGPVYQTVTGTEASADGLVYSRCHPYIRFAAECSAKRPSPSSTEVPFLAAGTRQTGFASMKSKSSAERDELNGTNSIPLEAGWRSDGWRRWKGWNLKAQPEVPSIAGQEDGRHTVTLTPADTKCERPRTHERGRNDFRDRYTPRESVRRGSRAMNFHTVKVGPH